MRQYLSAVRSLHITAGAVDPFQPRPPLLDRLLRGIQRVQANEGRRQTDSRLPLTVPLLARLRGVWNGFADQAQARLLWAAVCVGFFGCLQVGEFTVPSLREFSPLRHLVVRDLAVDRFPDPSWVRLRIKMSKTNQFGEEAFIFLGRAPPGGVCPVSALLANVAARSPQDGPLFLWPNGAPLTRGQLVDGLRAALDKAGVESERFGEHSLRIGAATEAARLGASTAVIQALDDGAATATCATCGSRRKAWRARERWWEAFRADARAGLVGGRTVNMRVLQSYLLVCRGGEDASRARV